MHRLAAVTLAALLYGCAAPVDTLRSEPAELVWQGPVAPRVTDMKPSRSRKVSDIPSRWLRVALCESGMRQRATSPTGRYLGYFQFSRRSWEWVGMTGDPRDYPLEVQYRAALRLYERQGAGAWPVCGAHLR